MCSSDLFSLSTATPGGAGAQWYKMDLSLEYQGSNSFLISSSLYTSDSTGVVGPLLDTYSDTRTITGLAGTPFYSGFQVFSAGNSPTRAGVGDNFSTTFVPEPTATGVLVVAGCGLLARRRRRQA